MIDDYFFIKCVFRWSENSVRFENLMEIGFQKGMYVVFFKVLITIQLQKTQGIISGEN